MCIAKTICKNESAISKKPVKQPRHNEMNGHIFEKVSQSESGVVLNLGNPATEFKGRRHFYKEIELKNKSSAVIGDVYDVKAALELLAFKD